MSKHFIIKDFVQRIFCIVRAGIAQFVNMTLRFLVYLLDKGKFVSRIQHLRIVSKAFQNLSRDGKI